MKLIKERRKALLNLSTLLAIILVSGAVSCCTYGHKNISQPVSANIHSSFLYVTSKNHVKSCTTELCFERVVAGSGSGFSVAVTKGFTIAFTAGHLCTPDDGTYKQELSVTTLGGKTYPAYILLTAPQTDTCMLGVPGVEVKPLRIAKAPVQRGEKVYALSAPFGLFDSEMIAQFEGFYAGPTDNVVPKGIPGADLKLYGYTIPSRPGSSGGPIINSRGEVIGMVIMAHPRFETFTLSPRQDDLVEILNMAIIAARAMM
tara:strand:+ start:2535 stop:3311 length:777 start_codon:yes stop_codon:yes gene_type:complete